MRDIGADKVEFKFKKPKSIEVAGSYSFQCITKPDLNIDVFIRLPKVFFPLLSVSKYLMLWLQLVY